MFVLGTSVATVAVLQEKGREVSKRGMTGRRGQIKNDEDLHSIPTFPSFSYVTVKITVTLKERFKRKVKWKDVESSVRRRQV